jgi:hypothetical protein
MNLDDRYLKVLAAFGASAVNIDRLKATPEAAPALELVHRMENYFTMSVDFLRSVFPNPIINERMAAVWDIVHYNIAPVVLGPDLPTIHFAALATVAEPAKGHAMFILPFKWLDMVHEDPLMQLGALVFTGSQAVDFYNEIIRSEEDSRKSNQRGRAYEAEFLLTLQKGGATLNEYQKKTLVEYPEGLASPAAAGLQYTSKPVTPSEKKS